MDNQTQPNTPSFQPQAQTPTLSSTNRVKVLSFILLGLVVVAGSVFVGIQIGKTQTPNTEPVIVQPTTSPTQTLINPTILPTPVSTTNPTTENINCSTTFSSKYLDLNFKYDNCIWKITEQMSNVNSGTTYYSIITALNNKTSNKVLIKAESIGMGGGYPGCAKVNNITLLEGNVVRFKKQNNTYLYLNEKNDFAIKGNVGNFGDTKFNEYFTFLNPEAFPDTNICWRTTGINPVKLLSPNGNEEKWKDITLSVEDTVSDDIFFQEADSLAVSFYSSLTK